MNSTPKIDRSRERRTIQLEAGPNQRLELDIAQTGAGQRALTLRELSWGNGVGWFIHKSLSLDSAQIESLLKALCCLRRPVGPESHLERRCPLAALPEGARPGGAEVLRVNFREEKHR